MCTRWRGTCGIVEDGSRPPRAPGAGATPTATRTFPPGGVGLVHLAFLYHGADDYLEHVLAFVRAGLAGSEPVFVALPDGLGWQVKAAAEFIAYRTHLSPVRALADRCAQAAGLSADRRADLVLAVSELAANTLTHTPGGGTAHI
jgi:hypothetical protein